MPPRQTAGPGAGLLCRQRSGLGAQSLVRQCLDPLSTGVFGTGNPSLYQAMGSSGPQGPGQHPGRQRRLHCSAALSKGSGLPGENGATPLWEGHGSCVRKARGTCSPTTGARERPLCRVVLGLFSDSAWCPRDTGPGPGLGWKLKRIQNPTSLASASRSGWAPDCKGSQRQRP